NYLVAQRVQVERIGTTGAIDYLFQLHLFGFFSFFGFRRILYGRLICFTHLDHAVQKLRVEIAVVEKAVAFFLGLRLVNLREGFLYAIFLVAFFYPDDRIILSCRDRCRFTVLYYGIAVEAMPVLLAHEPTKVVHYGS